MIELDAAFPFFALLGERASTSYFSTEFLSQERVWDLSAGFWPSPVPDTCLVNYSDLILDGGWYANHLPRRTRLAQTRRP